MIGSYCGADQVSTSRYGQEHPAELRPNRLVDKASADEEYDIVSEAEAITAEASVLAYA